MFHNYRISVYMLKNTPASELTVFDAKVLNPVKGSDESNDTWLDVSVKLFPNTNRMSVKLTKEYETCTPVERAKFRYTIALLADRIRAELLIRGKALQRNDTYIVSSNTCKFVIKRSVSL